MPPRIEQGPPESFSMEESFYEEANQTCDISCDIPKGYSQGDSIESANDPIENPDENSDIPESEESKMSKFKQQFRSNIKSCPALCFFTPLLCFLGIVGGIWTAGSAILDSLYNRFFSNKK